MYTPAAFSESDQEKLFDFIEQFSFGLLVTQSDDGLVATHLPLLLDRTAGQFGCFRGHMARANPQWQTADRRVLVVFSGPHTYISPRWYEAENVVPTWNYVAVHAYGTLQLVDDPTATLQILGDYVTTYGRSMPDPWQLDTSGDFMANMARSVAAFRIEITRMEGKWKLSQNQSRERQEKVVDALILQRDENAQAIAALMARKLHEQD